MSLSTLLEAAKYLDYLDSNPQQGQSSSQQQQQNLLKNDQSGNLQPPQSQFHRTQPTSVTRSIRRQRSSKKDAANTMVAMSLPASTGDFQDGVPIPLPSGSGMHGDGHHTSLSSSSFNTESPLSSFASTALLCSKVSGVTSASSSSAASSLSSSDSSSSCGEILMGDNDFNQSTPTSTSLAKETKTSKYNKRETSKSNRSNFTIHLQQSNNNNKSNMDASYHLQSLANNKHPQPAMVHKYSSSGSYNDRGQSFARYIAATSSGPQLITMTTTPSGGITSASAPIDGRIRAGHVIQAATQNAAATANFDQHQYSINALNGRGSDVNGQTSFSMASSLGSDSHLSSSPGSCPSYIMARVQPMILNSISPSAHQSLVAFQTTHGVAASSPTSSSSSYSRHRELHKTLEKNRRAHLRHCFELLKSELPPSECTDKKTSHINIIKSAIRFVLALRQQECEIDHEMQRLTKIKNDLTEQLSRMRNNNNNNNDPTLTINQQIGQIDQKQGLIGQNQVPPQQIDSVRVSNNTTSMLPDGSSANNTDMKQDQGLQNQPVAEHQLSILLSQSKID